ncbi:LuxR C-terminal-related transcriptional regulator [Streptomyces sp. NPDC048723]|uniref:LuxR C-terminal-related transcriptional regulator n=1 Tax=Streptomyces sp. NPDC048723 TaxID=3365589 RepID=UPI0037141E4F
MRAVQDAVERFAADGERTTPLHRDLGTLTPRELELLEALARALSNAEVAARFRLSEATVKTHVAGSCPNSACATAPRR